MSIESTNTQFKAVITNKSGLQSTAVSNGCVYFVDDTKELFFDFDSTRVEVKDILILDTDSQRTNILFNPLNKFYFVLETQKLWLYQNGIWYEISGSVDLSNYYTKSEVNALIPSTTNMVTTNTNQNIAGEKTFLGDKRIKFKQLTSTNKLGFTLYNNSTTEVGGLEYNPSSNILTLNAPKTGNTLVGFRYWNGNDSNNIIVPKSSSSSDFYIPLLFKNGSTIVATDASGVANLSTLMPNISGKADKSTTLSGYGITDAYTKTEVDSKLSAVYKFKGTVESIDSLPSSGNIIGDVYNVEDTGANYAWTESGWDKLSETIDLSGLQEKITTTNKLDADLVDDSSSTHKFVSASEKSTWNNKQDAIEDLADIRTGAEAGATAVQPSAISDMATKTWVGNQGYLTSHQDISGKANIEDLAEVAFSGSYDDLDNKPTIPSAVTESTVSGWGFTKNAGTITGIKMNGASKGTSGVVDLGTIITSHQDISGKANTSDLAAVATSGDYNDLDNLPTIPAAQVNSDWNATSGKAQILNKPELFSGDYNDLDNKPTIPTVNNAEIEIQKNSTKIGSFTTNQGGNKQTINITVPTTAGDVGALPNSTKYGATIDVTLSTTDYKQTITLKDQDGNTLSSKVVDFPVESMVVSGTFDSTNKKIVLTLQNGNTTDIPVGDLVAGLQTEITSSNKLSADLISDGTTNKTVTTTEKNTWNGKQNTITGGATTITSNNLTASRALVSDSNGKVAVSSITSTKLGYLTDVTSNIQAQINSKTSNVGTVTKVNNASPDANGNVTLSIPTKTSEITNDSGFITYAMTIVDYTS